jgi:hypothetical protein
MRTTEFALVGQPRPFGRIFRSSRGCQSHPSGILSEGDKRDSKSHTPESPPPCSSGNINKGEVRGRGRGYFAPEPATRTRPRRIYLRQLPLGCMAGRVFPTMEWRCATLVRVLSVQRLVEGRRCAQGFGWSRLLGNSYATCRTVSRA